MKRRTAQNTNTFSRDLFALEAFVVASNTESTWVPIPGPDGWIKRKLDYRPVQMELHRLVDAWRRSGPNVSKLFSAEKDLGIAAHNVQAALIATQGPRAKLFHVTAPQNMMPNDPNFIPFGLFLGFLTNSLNEQLGGPCACCKKFFIKKTRRKASLYCSQKCGSRSTARTANEKRRQADRERQLTTLRRAISDWPGVRSKLDWKEWVSKKTHISKNLITRMLREGLISEPKPR